MKPGNIYFNTLLIASPLLLPFSGCAENKYKKLPNVVFILSDDIGPGDIAAYHRERTGHKEVIPTPNIDRLASEGIRFRNANTPAALSAPTRYSIMTGSNTYRCREPWGVWNPFDPMGTVPADQKTVANVMKDAGYNTAFFGKWHLGGKFNKLDSGVVYPGGELWDDGWDYSEIVGAYPNSLGFDYSFELPNGIQGNPYTIYENGKWFPISKESVIRVKSKTSPKNSIKRYSKGDSNWETSKIGPLLSKKAAEFIENHKKIQSGKPFFIYYCSQAVHGPQEPPADFYGTPVKGTTPSGHGDMIFELDLQVGMIVDALKKAAEYENTLIIFTSDNGGLNVKEDKSEFYSGDCSSYGFYAEALLGHCATNGFRAQKGSMYEGGTRVPFIAMWPGVTPKGKVSDEPVLAHDLMATLYAVTGQDMPEGQAMDSYNLLPLLKDEAGAKGREFSLYQGGLPWPEEINSLKYIIRKGDWKLIINSDNEGNILDPFAFFNLKDNPYEVESKNFLRDPGQKERITEMYDYYKKLRSTKERTTELVRF